MNPVPLHFDEIQVGVRGRSGGRTLNETDLSFSCMLSGGWHPIHADAEFARTAPSGQRILHGSYCLLIATGLAADLPYLGDRVLADLGVRDWRYQLPVVVGDTLYADVEITNKRVTSNPLRGVLERRIQLIKADGSVAHTGISLLLVNRETITS
ncbi:MaoC/PaaZ C-terminal domain-containing protein [Achromobacter denitrificans]|uniref:MaoC/PaaZ C-terminal domain-containing protein n=1 Tax=Achromobacter denitrificans TaxID=32002 RepID=A0ABZ3FWZ5_ACHDE|nr:dehydratase [Achromobacter denitrificans]